MKVVYGCDDRRANARGLVRKCDRRAGSHIQGPADTPPEGFTIPPPQWWTTWQGILQGSEQDFNHSFGCGCKGQIKPFSCIMWLKHGRTWGNECKRNLWLPQAGAGKQRGTETEMKIQKEEGLKSNTENVRAIQQPSLSLRPRSGNCMLAGFYIRLRNVAVLVFSRGGELRSWWAQGSDPGLLCLGQLCWHHSLLCLQHKELHTIQPFPSEWAFWLCLRSGNYASVEWELSFSMY